MVQSSLLQSPCLSIYHPKCNRYISKAQLCHLIDQKFHRLLSCKKKKIENFFIIFIFSLSGLTKLNIFLFVLVLLLKDLKFHLISDLMLSDLFVLACVSSSFINISRSLNPVNSSRRLKQWHLVDIAHS